MRRLGMQTFNNKANPKGNSSYLLNPSIQFISALL